MAAYQLDGSELPAPLPELPFAFARNFGAILTERQGAPVLLCRQGISPRPCWRCAGWRAVPSRWSSLATTSSRRS